MTDTTHTPGPWFKGDVDTFDGIGITADSRACSVDIANIKCDFEGYIEIEQQANAHLIAAAPELYEALQEAIELANAANRQMVGVDFPASRKWRAALAKARGEDA